MRPDMERPGALAGATGPYTKPECAASREYSILLPFSPVTHAPASLGRLGVPDLHAATDCVLCGTVPEALNWALHFVAFYYNRIHRHESVIRTDREGLPVGRRGRHVTARPVRVIGRSGQA
jgi:hypothetical protein